MNQPMYAAGMVFSIIWLLMMLVGFASWIITIIALWRAMKAHEAISLTLKELVENFKRIQK